MSAPLVSFDLDGVLIQNAFRDCVVPRLRSIVRSAPALRHLPPEEADRRMADEVRRVWMDLQRAGEWVRGYDWDHVYGLAAERLGAPELPPVGPLVDACCEAREGIRLLPGASEGVALLSGAGVRMVAVTNNFSVVQAPVLAAFGILDRFEAVLGPDVLGTAKPDPAVFDGLNGLVAHVGDTLSTDVAAARDAGVRSVWIARGEARRAQLETAPRDTLEDHEWRTAWNEDPYTRLYPNLSAERHGRADAVALTPLGAAERVLAWLDEDGNGRRQRA